MPSLPDSKADPKARATHGRATLPSVSLPKGGGAIRGIGEKFAANPITGTASFSVPIYTSPGRAGFGPDLSLSYDSGAGNGPFGFGWNLSLPSITRKTDKGLPQYRDAEESDVFILSGVEDLVPVLVDGQRRSSSRTIGTTTYAVHRYRPRIEGLFARIERWTDVSSGLTHWRSISRDNVTTLYGSTEESRIADPADPTRVFSWLITESYDDKGNAVLYRYASENSQGLDHPPLHEANRTAASRKAQRYLKRILYGNGMPRLPDENLHLRTDWLFEVVFDYGDGHYVELPLDDTVPAEEQHRYVRAASDGLLIGDEPLWPVRPDPFSSCRAGFEVRTYRRCERILMFHRFEELAQGVPYLVRSTAFDYAPFDYSSKTPTVQEELDHRGSTRFGSFIQAITQCGFVAPVPPDVTVTHNIRYRRYLKRSLPALEFEYSRPKIDETVRELDERAVENLPIGLDGSTYQWLDLEGEGVSGILTEQAGGWFYKQNLSPLNERSVAELGTSRLVASMPAVSLAAGAQFMDLAGDGRPDVVAFEGAVQGFYERDGGTWTPFRAFQSFPDVNTNDPDVRFVDLDGDGHADILITEDEALRWYPSLGEKGFGPAARVPKPQDEEHGPRLVFSDGTQSIYLSDFSGDGLTDLVRVRNGEACYWPNVGYGRFGAKVTMDNAPCFDSPDLFEQHRVRLADIDGSGVTDLIYFGRDGVRLYLNQSGNRWSDARPLTAFPPIDNVASVAALDLLGNGTACLVWSSPLPAASRNPMRYVDLMSGQKPHLLVALRNNLGAETRVTYASSAKLYLADKRAGTPWITRLPFPVQVVERVETYDWISRNRFASRHAYHHGYFDGAEREFRGFGLVEQWDTEELGVLSASGDFPAGANIDAASFARPVLTRTWFHTGAYLEGGQVSRQFQREYYREPGLDDDRLQAMQVDDTVLPDNLPPDHIREAFRALKGTILRQEVYGRDGSEAQGRPYSVSERNYTIKLLQARGLNQHAVFFTHSRETIDFHYERALFDVNGTKVPDPRVSHDMVLAVDDFGNVLQSVAVVYGRRYDAPDDVLTDDDRKQQKATRLTCTDSMYTRPVSDLDAHRTPLPAVTRTYELLKVVPGANRPGVTNLFRFDELRARISEAGDGAHDLPYEDIEATSATENRPYRRLVEHIVTVYRADDLSRLLDVGDLQPLALPGETYKLAFTRALVSKVYRRGGHALLPDADAVMAEGGYVRRSGDPGAAYWLPSGRIFYSRGSDDAPPVELAHARAHFFLPCRSRDPFWRDDFRTDATLRYDRHDLLVLEAEDALENRVTAGERDDTLAADDPARITPKIDYRVLQPQLLTDPNGNRTEVRIDALGLVVATIQMGKPGEDVGDAPSAVPADLTRKDIDAFFEAANPRSVAEPWLSTFTTRIVYDLERFMRTRVARPRAPETWEPAFAATIARETHVRALNGGTSALQVSFAYSDGFGREIQKKAQAEPGPVPARDPATGRIIVDADGLPSLTSTPVAPRWVGTGWTVFNNKAKPVQQYEPFFTDTHRFEFDVRIGVTVTSFYDPVDRVVATLHPDGTYDKVSFDPWREKSWDVNDTVLLDPRTDDEVRPSVEEYLASLALQGRAWKTWYAARANGGLGALEQLAAAKTKDHANTPAVVYFDSLGRSFLTIAHNRRSGGADEKYRTRIRFDIDGNERSMTDARNRVAITYDYDLLGNRIHQASMDAGERWMLSDVLGQPIRAWDSRGHSFKTESDRLRRAIHHFVEGADSAANASDPHTLNGPVLFEKMVYGEGRPGAAAANLRTRLYQIFDAAGAITNEEYDFKSNLRRTVRHLTTDYKGLRDWRSASPDGQRYTTSTTYDAVNRPVEIATPDGSVVRPSYNDANLLNAVDVNVRGETDDATGEPVWTPFVRNIDYDAKGQRALIEYGNSVTTTYTYDRRTYRLRRLLTTRAGTAFADDCAEPPPAGWPGSQVQNVHYTYDPAGNITHVRDEAQQRIFFRNKRVEPSADYTYDAIYRLIQATGRELLGLDAAHEPLAPSPMSCRSWPRTGSADPRDGKAVGTYTQEYVYDEVGNILSIRHQGTDPAHAGWQRCYQYANDSNRLLSAGDPNEPHDPAVACPTHYSATPVYGERFAHDAHGNMLGMPHLQAMTWDCEDRLQMTRRQAVNASDEEGLERDGERTFYVYDGNGRRVRKVTELSNGTVKDERVYLGAYEVYRRHGTNAIVRETLHINDDNRRVALVETTTRENGADIAKPKPLARYQFANHLGSSVVELDSAAEKISYEEYYPYGGTSYQATYVQTESARRYRYTGKERDEETGLYYYGARYYAPWLVRWIASEPEWSLHDDSSFAYADGSPVTKSDPDGRRPKPTKQGRLEAAAMLAVDEDVAVRGANRGSPTDPSNKRFTPQQDNASKGAQDLPASARKSTGVVSLKDMKRRGLLAKGAAHMLSHNFDKTRELNTIAKRAAEKTEDWAKKKGLNPNDPVQAKGDAARRAMADDVNKRIRKEIRKGKSAEAKIVREALNTASVDERLRIKTVDIQKAAQSPATQADARAKVAQRQQGTPQGTSGKHGFGGGGAGAGGGKPAAGGGGLRPASGGVGKPAGGSKGAGFVGKAMAVKGAVDSLEQGDYIGAVTSVASLNPAVSTALTLQKAHEEYAKGNTMGAVLEVASLNPVVGAAKSGWEIGRALDEEYQLGETAITYWAQKLGYDAD